MQRHHRGLLAVLPFLVMAPTVARAQAFGINEIGSCAFSRGMAATSAPCKDASAIYWNPAATAGMKGNSILAGAAAIALSSKFTRDSALGEHESDAPMAAVPHLFINRGMGKMAVGLGVYVPYGLTSQWKDDFPGRFLAKKASIKSIYFQPNFAISIKDGRWMFGGGPVFAMSSVELVQAADLSEQVASVDSITVPTTRTAIRYSQLGIAKRTEFARATLNGSSTAMGITLGGIGKINDKWTFGFRYLSALLIDYDNADATFKQMATGIKLAAGNPLGLPANTLLDTLTLLRSRFCNAATGNMPDAPGPVAGSTQPCTAKGLLATQTVNTSIAHPDQLQFGFAYHGWTNWLISVDVDITGWKKFGVLPVDFSQDTLPTCPTPKAVTDPVCDFNSLDRAITATSGMVGVPDHPLLEDYNNTSSLRVGVEHTLSSGWIVRAGFSGAAAASPDETVTPLLPEQDRNYYSLGTEIPLIKDKVTIDAAYGFVLGTGRRGRIDERLARTVTATAINSGIYDLHASVFSVSLKANF